MNKAVIKRKLKRFEADFRSFASNRNKGKFEVRGNDLSLDDFKLLAMTDGWLWGSCSCWWSNPIDDDNKLDEDVSKGLFFEDELDGKDPKGGGGEGGEVTEGIKDGKEELGERQTLFIPWPKRMWNL